MTETGKQVSQGVGARLARLVVRRPGWVLLVALAVMAATAPLVLRLRLDTDLVDLVPAGSPGAAAFARFTRAFVGEQALVVLVESSDGSKLTDFADRYAEALRGRPDVAEVRVRLGAASADLVRRHLLDLLDDAELDALAARITPAALTAQAQRLRGLLSAPGGSALAPLLTSDPLELLQLVGPRMSAGLPVDTRSGYFKSADGQALLLFVRSKHDAFDIEADRALLSGCGAVAAELGATVGDGSFGAPPPATPRVDFTGPFSYAPEYRDWLHRDMQASTVVSALTVLLAFALLLGAVRVLPWVALPLLLGLWLTAAMAVVLFGRINAVSLAFGTILISIGIDLPIQLYNRLREELTTPGPDGAPVSAAAAVETTIARLAGTSLLAALGPAAVFFACGLSHYKGLRELGLLAGCGLIFNVATMLTVLPALLVALPRRWWAPRRRPPAEGEWFAWLGRQAARRPKLVLASVAVLALAVTPLALRLRYERQLISSVEPQGMRSAKVQREIEKRMGQRQQMLIALVEDADKERALARSDAWRAEAERLRRAGVLASYQSVSNLFPSLTEQTKRREKLARLDGAKVARDLRAALEETGFDVAPFAGFLEQLERPPPPLTLADGAGELSFLVTTHVHDDPKARLVATYLFPPPGGLEPALAALERFAGGPAGGQVTGVPVLEEVLRHILEGDTVRVTAVSVVAVVLLLIAAYRRPRPVLAVILPLTVAWVLFAAALALLDIPLNLFNLLAVPLVVGYGIDDHVFLVHRHLDDPTRSPAYALASTGRAIVVTSLSTMAGFAGMAVARFDGLRQLGISGALAVGLCLLAAFAVLPALLAILWPIRPSLAAPMSRDAGSPPPPAEEDAPPPAAPAPR